MMVVGQQMQVRSAALGKVIGTVIGINMPRRLVTVEIKLNGGVVRECFPIAPPKEKVADKGEGKNGFRTWCQGMTAEQRERERVRLTKEVLRLRDEGNTFIAIAKTIGISDYTVSKFYYDARPKNQ